MKWVYVTFSEMKDGHHVQSSLCHPKMAKNRIKYVCEKYGVTVTKIDRWSESRIDLGGMMLIGAPTVDVVLGKDRTFWCWKHQLSWIVEDLKKGGRVETYPSGTYHKFASFPGFIVHLSSKDIKRILKVLEPQVSHAEEQAHNENTLNALVEANAHAHPDLPKEALKKVLREHRNRGRKVIPPGEVN